MNSEMVKWENVMDNLLTNDNLMKTF